MTLVQALQAMLDAGFTQVKDDYSRRPKPIVEFLEEARLDLNDYTPDPKTGRIVQNHDTPCYHHLICS